MYLFHGSPARNIDHFKLENSRYQSLEGTGIYFTLNYRFARKYAGSEGSIYKCTIKTDSYFDATQENDFIYLFEKISQLISYDILKLKDFNKLISGLLKGQYEINEENNQGLSSHLIRFLKKDENFFSHFESDDIDQIFENITKFIKNYMSQYSVMKYNSGEPSVGAFFIVRDCSLISIRSEIEVGSDLDIEYLENEE